MNWETSGKKLLGLDGGGVMEAVLPGVGCELPGRGYFVQLLPWLLQRSAEPGYSFAATR